MEFRQYRLLAIGIVLLLASSFLLAQVSIKQSQCESVTGKIVQLFDLERRDSCSNLVYLKFAAYAGIGIGIALVVVQFVRQS
ncbi:hypothetical protein KY363_00085 [Candidatus Woesearchaeota archaeon]|nr:hypothetical protein [Candidatus Woesearchaeota archaeon]